MSSTPAAGPALAERRGHGHCRRRDALCDLRWRGRRRGRPSGSEGHTRQSGDFNKLQSRAIQPQPGVSPWRGINPINRSVNQCGTALAGPCGPLTMREDNWDRNQQGDETDTLLSLSAFGRESMPDEKVKRLILLDMSIHVGGGRLVVIMTSPLG